MTAPGGEASAVTRAKAGTEAGTAATRTLRSATHLGYRPPFEPLFRSLVGSDDPLEHVRFAAEQGFAGVQVAAARRWSEDEQQRVGEAFAAHGLQAGCMLYTTFDKLRRLGWGDEGTAAREWIDAELDAALAAAARVGTRALAILGAADPARPLAPQQQAFAQHLRRTADRAARAGVTLCLEPVDAQRVPGMLLHRMADAVAVVQAAGHPGVRLIFDTAHVQAMEGELLRALDLAWRHLELVQIADHPGRVEPGRGGIRFDTLLRALVERGYSGLVELEHGWAEPGIESEREGLRRWRELVVIASAGAGTAATAGVDRR